MSSKCILIPEYVVILENKTKILKKKIMFAVHPHMKALLKFLARDTPVLQGRTATRSSIKDEIASDIEPKHSSASV